MKVGIVGSRKRIDKSNVIKLVDSLNKKDIVVSGGCKGVDTWAIERAKERKMNTIIILPEKPTIETTYFDAVKRFYKRNEAIAKEADIIYAFVSFDRKGGTENTIKHAKKLGKEVVIK